MEEQHPLFPSGPWAGFYVYHGSSERHLMACALHFSEGRIEGTGSDDIDFFTWSGTYDTETLQGHFRKTYASHIIYYRGDVDENGIWGNWRDGVPSGYTGGFHLWPVADKEENQLAEVLEISMSA
jgi:hypothetical protein